MGPLGCIRKRASPLRLLGVVQCLLGLDPPLGPTGRGRLVITPQLCIIAERGSRAGT